MANENYYVYILASKRNGTLYTGVTCDLKRRVIEHKLNLNEGFTSKYHVHNLVYFRQVRDISTAIAEEKRIKRLRRYEKLRLIENFNPDWLDLFDQI
jgi:putative endonuclease